MVGSKEDIAGFRTFLEQYPGQAAVSESEVEDDPSRYQFGWIDAAAIMTVIQTTLYAGELPVRIVRWMKDNHDRDRLIVLQTPFEKIEIRSRYPMTEEEVQEKLAMLAGKKKKK